LDGGDGNGAFGVSGSQFIGIGVWIILIFALIQGVFTLWQKPLCTRYEAWCQSRARREKERNFHYRPSATESIMRHIPFISSDVLALLLKDIRVFWRDTAQWGQSLILFGILGVYILNLRFFTEQFTSLFTGGRLGSDYFFKLISFMNLAACALNLATLTTRFVYPQFSLEGKRLWIVGMSPLGLARVVKVKFLLATSISLLISFPLIWLSSNMLQLPTSQSLFFCGAISIMAIALNGLAVGMGVMYPNLKEDNPSKIVSGFGGTFCLMISFVYIGLAVMMLGIGSPFGSPWQISDRADVGQQMIYMGMFIFVSLTIGLGPFWYALHRARNFEH
jgi:ABC-2 type transport system permease protein